MATWTAVLADMDDDDRVAAGAGAPARRRLSRRRRGARQHLRPARPRLVVGVHGRAGRVPRRRRRGRRPRALPRHRRRRRGSRSTSRSSTSGRSATARRGGSGSSSTPPAGSKRSPTGGEISRPRLTCHRPMVHSPDALRRTDGAARTTKLRGIDVTSPCTPPRRNIGMKRRGGIVIALVAVVAAALASTAGAGSIGRRAVPGRELQEHAQDRLHGAVHGRRRLPRQRAAQLGEVRGQDACVEVRPQDQARHG